MTDARNKYSLWLVPTGEAGRRLQGLVDELAESHDAPKFVPHLTLIANIYASTDELEVEKQKIQMLTQKIDSFTVNFTNYRYADEEFRSLFLLAQSEALDDVYQAVAEVFPQVANEHFRAMPHLSVLYGLFSPVTKQRIIETHSLPSIECTIESFDLYHTNDPVASWQLEQRFDL
jgi:2'-5' RNA ligase